MWDPENFPGADNVPWQLLIRARFAHQVDAVVASVVVEQIGRFASFDVTEQVSKAAAEGLRLSPRDEAGAEQRVAVLNAVADYDELCPRKPFPWPPRPHQRFDELTDPISEIVIAGALELVRTAGSEALNKTLGETLGQVGAFGG